MTEKSVFLDTIKSIYDDSCYPEEFLAEYSLMECLSDRQGVETYLAQEKSGDKFVAKCFDKSIYDLHTNIDILKNLNHVGLPKHAAVFENEQKLITVREYIEGVPLSRYADENELTEKEIISICAQLCDVLSFLHDRPEPIIHRDIKPQNIIVKSSGDIALIDFDIARVFQKENDTDTYFFGTLAYAPPEQYGFSQTDVRSDIYSLGILLRWLLTGSTKDNKKIRIYRPLQKIINKCTSFDPKKRFANSGQVKKRLLAANPKTQRLHAASIIFCVLLVAALATFGGWKWHEYVTFDPFAEGHIPSVATDEERTEDALTYLEDKYGTHLFDDSEAYSTVGLVKEVLVEMYGMDKDYVYGIPKNEIPNEDPNSFFPWNLGNEQYMDRDYLAYVVVKTYWPNKVSDWSSLKDDNGAYPGIRVAEAWCDETGIMTGVVRPKDLTRGQIAIAFANADRVYEALKKD